jgi:pimeloyl-ACP methyl ester carboxylesterase
MVPFTPLAQFPPEGYEGPFYIDDFTDMAIKRRWAALSDERKHEIRGLRNLIAVPNQFRETGRADPRGRIDPHAEIDLCGIRRPSFFGQAPWNEPIAEVDGRTHVVEFAVPAEPAEVMHLGSTEPVKLRGWLIEGTGVDDGAGGQRRALAILTAGRSVETTALHHPDDAPAHWDAGTGTWLRNDYRTSARTEGWGVGGWRANHILALNRAGFDVLTLDKRGHGISGGLTDSNTNEQAEDIFRVLNALETGSGLRIARPDGSIGMGEELAGELLLGYSSAKDIPVLLGGASQGCMVTCWAMYKNVVGASDFERPVPAAYGPKGYNLIGAILLAPFSGGLGYRPADDAMAEASRRLEQNVQTFPTSEVLGSVPLWPALFIGRGLWDYAESLEGSLAAYRAATGPKTLVTVRGPHGENEWGTENIAYMRDCIFRFATNLIAGRSMADLPQPRSLRDAVQLAPAHWPVEARRPTSL